MAMHINLFRAVVVVVVLCFNDGTMMIFDATSDWILLGWNHEEMKLNKEKELEYLLDMKLD